MKWIKQLFCKHKYEPMAGFMGFFCKVQCVKCDKIDNDFRDAVVTHYSISIKVNKEF